MVVISKPVNHEFLIVYAADHKAVAVIILSIKCTSHDVSKMHAIEKYVCFMMVSMHTKVC